MTYSTQRWLIDISFQFSPFCSCFPSNLLLVTNETPTRLLFHTVSYQQIKFDLDLSWRYVFTLEFTEMAENVSGKICFHFRPILATPYLWQMLYFTKYNSRSTHYLKKCIPLLYWSWSYYLEYPEDHDHQCIILWLVCCVFTIWSVGELWRPALLQKQPISLILELRLLPHGEEHICIYIKYRCILKPSWKPPVCCLWL